MTKDNDTFNKKGYGKACQQVEFLYPKLLPKKITASQAKSLIYNLADKLKAIKNYTKRYLYTQFFISVRKYYYFTFQFKNLSK